MIGPRTCELSGCHGTGGCLAFKHVLALVSTAKDPECLPIRYTARKTSCGSVECRSGRSLARDAPPPLAECYVARHAAPCDRCDSANRGVWETFDWAAAGAANLL